MIRDTRRPIKFDPLDEDQIELLCPNCGGNNTHHDQITIYHSNYVNSKSVTEVDVSNVGGVNHAEVSADKTRAPYAGDDGVAIRFWCEGCKELHELIVWQRKGVTYLGCRYVGESI